MHVKRYIQNYSKNIILNLSVYTSLIKKKKMLAYIFITTDYIHAYSNYLICLFLFDTILIYPKKVKHNFERYLIFCSYFTPSISLQNFLVYKHIIRSFLNRTKTKFENSISCKNVNRIFKTPHLHSFKVNIHIKTLDIF